MTSIKQESDEEVSGKDLIFTFVIRHRNIIMLYTLLLWYIKVLKFKKKEEKVREEHIFASVKNAVWL